MIARLKLLDCQRSLSQSFQQSADLYLGRLPNPLKKYSFAYFQELRSYRKISHKSNILKEICGAQIVLFGDYHSLSQAQRTVMRILREIVPKLKKEKKPLYLGLEALRVQDNIRTQQYLRKEISESKFLKSAAFEDWGFNWQNYAPLFDMAQQWEIPIIGLSPNRSSSPETRDKYGAKILSNWTEEHPDSLLLALIGDFHLAQNHLPTKIKEELNSRELKRKVLTIHQNSDSLYWKVAHRVQGKPAEVLQLKKDVYCILNTAPWVKMQSYLSWMENLYSESFDPSSEIATLLKAMAQFLELEEPQALLSQFELKYDQFSTLCKELRRNKGLSFYQRKALEIKLKNSQYLLLRTHSQMYLTSSNLNHLSSLSGQYLHAQLSGLKVLLEDPEKDFYHLVWVEALGYFGSKIINPKRKCKGIKDFKNSRDPVEQKVFRHVELERKFRSAFQEKPLDLSCRTYPVAKLLGKLLGEGIFELMIRNQVSFIEIQELFRNPFNRNPVKQYLQWVRRLDKTGVRDFSFRDQL